MGDYDAIIQADSGGTRPHSITYLTQTNGTRVTKFESLLSIDDVSLAEGNSGTKNFTFAVSLSETSSQDVTVRYATANGTALSGSDYTADGGTLTFAPGETTKNILLVAIDDIDMESTETFTVNLSNPTGGGVTIADAQAVATIIDDDTRFVMIESWAAEADLEAHKTSPAMKDIVGAFGAFLAGAPVMHQYE